MANEARASFSLDLKYCTMPHIVLNDLSCKQFPDGETTKKDEMPDIGWLNSTFSLKAVEDGDLVNLHKTTNYVV